MTNATQSFKIQGSGMKCTFVQSGVDFAAGGTSDALSFRDFKSISLSDLTVRFCKYGFYPRDCEQVHMRNVRFVNCGSDGTENRHDQSGTQAEQATFYASSSTSSGGACRIRGITEVSIHDCEVSYSLRGLRIQDCGTMDNNSIISNCRCFRTIESGVYLAHLWYSGSVLHGSKNFLMLVCQVEQTFNN